MADVLTIWQFDACPRAQYAEAPRLVTLYLL
jgi:hypothetical protein